MTRRRWTELTFWQLLGATCIYLQLTEEQFPIEGTLGVPLTLFLMVTIALGYWWEARHRRIQPG